MIAGSNSGSSTTSEPIQQRFSLALPDSQQNIVANDEPTKNIKESNSLPSLSYVLKMLS